MELSAIGSAVLVAREGRRLEAYRDSVGIWTIGVGHTSAAGPPAVRQGLRLTVAECDALFARDVARFADSVRQAVPETLAQHEFDALVSLCFNIGPTAFRRSSVVRHLQAGDGDGAAQAILLWNRPAVLIPRRGAEYDQFRTPYAVALPRARRGDATPIPRPAGAPAPVIPPLPAARRPVPRGQGLPPVQRRPSPGEPSAALTGWLAQLWERLRAKP